MAEENRDWLSEKQKQSQKETENLQNRLRAMRPIHKYNCIKTTCGVHFIKEEEVTRKDICPTCKGKTYIRKERMFGLPCEVCPSCGGTGKKIDDDSEVADSCDGNENLMVMKVTQYDQTRTNRA